MTEQGRSLVYPGEIKSYVYTMTCTQISIAGLFMITPIWTNKQKNAHQLVNTLNCGISYNGVVLSSKKEQTTDACNILDKS